MAHSALYPSSFNFDVNTPNLWLLLSPRSLELVHSISAIWRVFVVLRIMTNRSLRTSKIGQLRSETVGHQKLGITTNVGCDPTKKLRCNHQENRACRTISTIKNSWDINAKHICSAALILCGSPVRFSDCPCSVTVEINLNAPTGLEIDEINGLFNKESYCMEMLYRSFFHRKWGAYPTKPQETTKNHEKNSKSSVFGWSVVTFAMPQWSQTTEFPIGKMGEFMGFFELISASLVWVDGEENNNELPSGKLT